MENIKKAQERLVNAIVAMHPELCMGDAKQEELYLAMHDLTSKMAKLNECESQKPDSSENTLPIADVKKEFCDCQQPLGIRNQPTKILNCYHCKKPIEE